MPAPRMHWTAYLWPGLPHLWMRGSWAGLAVAVGFTALANTMLLATFVFTEWITVNARLLGYGVLAGVWLLARWQTRDERRSMAVEPSPDGSEPAVEIDVRQTEVDRLFCEAQQRYVANDWVVAEQLLLKLLKQDAKDVEGRLLLATLWRHQGRREEARRQLDRLERLEAAARWQHEIDAEREQLEAEPEPTTLALPERAENPDETTETTEPSTAKPNRHRAA